MLSLLVLRAHDVEITANFYRALGFDFKREQHAVGPEHLACECDGFVLEIYPLRPNQTQVSDSVTLGFRIGSLDDLPMDVQVQIGETRFCTLRDPDGRPVRLEEA